MSEPLRVVVLKPSKYLPNGSVERFRRGFMPNSTVPYLRSMTPPQVSNTPVEVHAIDEYVHTDLQYLSLLRHRRGWRRMHPMSGGVERVRQDSADGFLPPLAGDVRFQVGTAATEFAIVRRRGPH